MRLHKSISHWLLVCALLVFAMVVIGGLTRLTESGLSIVEWKPITGTLPPLNHAAWEKEFLLYQASPQYKKINLGMTLEQFRHIYWLEYIHRLLGRLVGVAFFLPLLFFMSKRAMPAFLTRRLVLILLLGGMQGAVGWYMVKSGLVDVPMVSPLRLAFHLGMAFIILALLLWSWRDAEEIDTPAHIITYPSFLHIGSYLLIGLLFVQILLGALVAGLDGGLTYNTFPLMDGKWLPPGLTALSPVIRNMYENVTMVQFNHRLMAYSLAVILPVYCLFGIAYTNDIQCKKWLLAILGVFLLQFTLGVATLLLMVPISLASLHQANAALLFAISVLWCRALHKKLKTRE